MGKTHFVDDNGGYGTPEGSVQRGEQRGLFLLSSIVSDALGSPHNLPGLSFMNMYKGCASSGSSSLLLRFRPFVCRVA